MQIKIILSFLTTLIVFLSCRPKNDLLFSDKLLKDIPDSIIQIDTMAKVLVDIHLAESLSQINKKDTLDTIRTVAEYYGEVMFIHKIDEEAFRRSYSYYINEPVLTNYIYRKVSEQLSLLESKYKLRPGNKTTDKKNE